MTELTGLNSRIKLNNGVSIPCVGYGSFRTPADVGRKAVADAIKVGYRLIDTASRYGNEEAIGQGIKDSGIKREDLFVTSKLWNDMRGYDNARKSFLESLDRLGLDYLDLYLIHWPATKKQFGDEAKKINAETWRALEDLYHEGKVRAIGVSNFLPHHLEELMETATVKPVIDQIEVHPGFPHTEEVKWLKDHEIAVEAWAPLGGQGSKVMSDPTINKIAEKYGKSAAQVTLRWILERGIIPLPKSVHENRMIQNKEIFDFSLTDEEMAQISSLTDLGGFCVDPDEVDF